MKSKSTSTKRHWHHSEDKQCTVCEKETIFVVFHEHESEWIYQCTECNNKFNKEGLRINKMLLSYYVEYLPPGCPEKYMHSTAIFGTSREEVDIVIHNMYPHICNAQNYRIGTGYTASKVLAAEGKVTYLNDVIKRELI